MTRLTLTSFLLGSIPAIAAIVSAIVAGWFAVRAKAHESAAQHVRDLENRISEKKYDVYKPMVNTLRDVFDKEKSNAIATNAKHTKEFQARLTDFAIWVTIYGSDDAVRCFRNFMQSTFADAPAQILIRLYAEFVLAARRDIGRSDTSIDAVDVMGIRINDLYTGGDFLPALTEPFELVCERFEWKAPWLTPAKAG